MPYGTCGCPKPLLLQTGLRRTCFLQPALRFHISPNRCSATALGLQFILNFVYNHAAPRQWWEIYLFDFYSLFGEISVPYGTCGCPKPLLLQTGLRRICFLQPALRFHISPNRCSATALGLQFILMEEFFKTAIVVENGDPFYFADFPGGGQGIRIFCILIGLKS